jgi:sugar/nucleoside kinase (ribokinase family)
MVTRDPHQRALDLLVVGDCNPDLLLTGSDLVPEFDQREKRIDGATLTLGGSASILACGAARLGLRTALVAAMGDDLFGRFALDAVAERGVDVAACPTVAAPTGLTVALSREHDRAMLTHAGAIAALTAADVPRPLLAAARHMHIASYFLLDGLRPGLPGLVDEAHAAGVTVSVDPQGDPAGEWGSGLPELAAQLDILFVNEGEDARIDSRACPLVVVKRGREGARARTADGEVEAPGLAIDPVDSTGAGDSFDAGFLAALLDDTPLEQALALACACGALSTQAAGGTAAQPTLEEARRALR